MDHAEVLDSCPFCRETVAARASVCPHCRRNILVDVKILARVDDPRERYRLARQILEYRVDVSMGALLSRLEGGGPPVSPPPA